MSRFIAGIITGLLLASFTGLGLLACRVTAEDSPGQAPPEAAPGSGAVDWPAALAHHNFILQSANGRELPEKDPEGMPRAWPHISFGQWPEVSGRLCNNFRGQAEVTDAGRLKIFAASTKMMCLEESLNQLETTFHQITTEGAELYLSPDGRLLTLSGSGHTLLFFLKDYVQ